VIAIGRAKRAQRALPSGIKLAAIFEEAMATPLKRKTVDLFAQHHCKDNISTFTLIEIKSGLRIIPNIRLVYDIIRPLMSNSILRSV
jgi:hypothetical protein